MFDVSLYARNRMIVTSQSCIHFLGLDRQTTVLVQYMEYVSVFVIVHAKNDFTFVFLNCIKYSFCAII